MLFIDELEFVVSRLEIVSNDMSKFGRFRQVQFDSKQANVVIGRVKKRRPVFVEYKFVEHCVGRLLWLFQILVVND